MLECASRCHQQNGNPSSAACSMFSFDWTALTCQLGVLNESLVVVDIANGIPVFVEGPIQGGEVIFLKAQKHIFFWLVIYLTFGTENYSVLVKEITLFKPNITCCSSDCLFPTDWYSSARRILNIAPYVYTYGHTYTEHYIRNSRKPPQYDNLHGDEKHFLLVLTLWIQSLIPLFKLETLFILHDYSTQHIPFFIIVRVLRVRTHTLAATCTCMQTRAS